jgi:hypothetical protein
VCVCVCVCVCVYIYIYIYIYTTLGESPVTTARPQVADGVDALHVWREAPNILNKQSRTADKG